MALLPWNTSSRKTSSACGSIPSVRTWYVPSRNRSKSSAPKISDGSVNRVSR